MVTVKDVAFGGFKTDVTVDECVYAKIREDAIEECKQILLDAMAKDGKTKCHNYMVAVSEMEKLKEK